jgi:hypothetical protein
LSDRPLGRTREAKAAVDKLLKLYPDIARNFRNEDRKYNVTPGMVEHMVAGLRKAGLDIPSEIK